MPYREIFSAMINGEVVTGYKPATAADPVVEVVSVSGTFADDQRELAELAAFLQKYSKLPELPAAAASALNILKKIMIRITGEPAWQIRQYAAMGPDAVDEIIAFADHKEPRIRRIAYQSLSEMAVIDQKIMQACKKGLGDKNSSVRAAAAELWTRDEMFSNREPERFKTPYRCYTYFVQDNIAALEKAGRAAEPALRSVVNNYQYEDSKHVLRAVRLLREIDVFDQRSIDALIGVAGRPSDKFSIAALLVLARNATYQQISMDYLMNMFTEPVYKAQAAMYAAVKIFGPVRRLEQNLLRLYKRSEYKRKSAIVEILWIAKKKKMPRSYREIKRVAGDIVKYIAGDSLPGRTLDNEFISFADDLKQKLNSDPARADSDGVRDHISNINEAASSSVSYLVPILFAVAVLAGIVYLAKTAGYRYFTMGGRAIGRIGSSGRRTSSEEVDSIISIGEKAIDDLLVKFEDSPDVIMNEQRNEIIDVLSQISAKDKLLAGRITDWIPGVLKKMQPSDWVDYLKLVDIYIERFADNAGRMNSFEEIQRVYLDFYFKENYRYLIDNVKDYPSIGKYYSENPVKAVDDIFYIYKNNKRVLGLMGNIWPVWSSWIAGDQAVNDKALEYFYQQTLAGKDSDYYRRADFLYELFYLYRNGDAYDVQNVVSVIYRLAVGNELSPEQAAYLLKKIFTVEYNLDLLGPERIKGILQRRELAAAAPEFVYNAAKYLFWGVNLINSNYDKDTLLNALYELGLDDGAGNDQIMYFTAQTAAHALALTEAKAVGILVPRKKLINAQQAHLRLWEINIKDGDGRIKQWSEEHGEGDNSYLRLLRNSIEEAEAKIDSIASEIERNKSDASVWSKAVFEYVFFDFVLKALREKGLSSEMKAYLLQELRDLFTKNADRIIDVNRLNLMNMELAGFAGQNPQYESLVAELILSLQSSGEDQTMQSSALSVEEINGLLVRFDRAEGKFIYSLDSRMDAARRIEREIVGAGWEKNFIERVLKRLRATVRLKSCEKDLRDIIDRIVNYIEAVLTTQQPFDKKDTNQMRVDALKPVSLSSALNHDQDINGGVNLKEMNVTSSSAGAPIKFNITSAPSDVFKYGVSFKISSLEKIDRETLLASLG